MSLPKAVIAWSYVNCRKIDRQSVLQAQLIKAGQQLIAKRLEKVDTFYASVLL